MPSPRSAEFRNTRAAGVLLLGAVTLVFFGDVLFGSHEVLSEKGADVWKQFAGWRHFAFEQIREGNFPLWTPLVFSGMPFFSGFQSAMLYPPNWIHLALPLGAAINWGIALHVFWLGCGVLLWLRYLGLRQVPALFAATVAMFCAPHFLHISAGHLSNLCVMAWVPWLFLAVDRWRDGNALRWIAAGALVVGMQILAGHVQYVYYGAIATGVYALLLSTAKAGWPEKIKFLGGFAAMYLLAAVVTAIQLFPGLEAAAESLRGAGGRNAREFAASYSFPPENVITLLAPRFFGDNASIPYWGRWSFAEMNAFIGVAALCCAAVGIVASKKGDRRPLFLLAGCVVCGLLALGSYTPLFDLLFNVLPGYDAFRGNSKFVFFAAFFGIALAAFGLDRLLDDAELPKKKALLIAGILFVAVTAGAGAWIETSSRQTGGTWESWHRSIAESPDIVRDPARTELSLYLSPAHLADSARAARNALWIAAATAAAVLACIVLRRRLPFAIHGIALAGVIEVLVFSIPSRAAFPRDGLDLGYERGLRAQYPGDYRVRDFHREHGGMLSGLPDVWGEDPGMPARYARFVGATQQVTPDRVSQNLEVRSFHPLLQLLRLRFVIAPDRQGIVGHEEFPGEPMRRVEFFTDYRVTADREKWFAALTAPDFDPRRRVILEEAPGVSITPGASVDSAAWRIEREDTDEIVLSVNVPASCIMLMTDSWSSGWRVENISGNAPQDEYRILPANHCLRAIPLEPGEHRLRVYYLPRSLKPAAAASALGLILCVGGLFSKRTLRRS